MKRLRTRLTYANVTATIALFLSLGAVSWAAITLPRNSVRSVNIVKGQVKRTDIGRRAVNRPRIAPGSINRARIAPNAVDGGRVADASLTGSDLAPFSIGPTRIAPAEQPHRVGGAGEPQFESSGARTWTTLAGATSELVFYKDQLGNVHLEGAALCVSASGACTNAAAGNIFTLPPGYRPAQGLIFLVYSDGAPDPGAVLINGIDGSDPGEVRVVRINNSGGSAGNLYLEGVEFRAAG